MTGGPCKTVDSCQSTTMAAYAEYWAIRQAVIGADRGINDDQTTKARPRAPPQRKRAALSDGPLFHVARITR
ncbi:hypothetical protein KY389_13395 [Paracoccus bogoriensis]|uniref:hypothetical protein n=1 Tax=Paracoccus bogoriensis TaxID=242065 RepID=UPI001CA48F2D|nr:hypothetical protein [Paracoccus bogoriensis]MBW7057665.1 hypothetical protein [Paracoccus bogoriensis]